MINKKKVLLYLKRNLKDFFAYTANHLPHAYMKTKNNFFPHKSYFPKGIHPQI
jgi:hypothetical protein